MGVIFGDSSRYYTDPAGFVVWDGSHIMRCPDILASPVWERIDSGISGTIYDCQMVIRDNDDVGAWLLTSTAVWWCADIEAASPSWSSVLAIATVQASDAVPSSGVVEFKCFGACQSDDSFCIVATGPVTYFANSDYAHSYYWHTHDHGATWTQVDNNSAVSTVGPNYHYPYSDRFSMQCYPSLVGGDIKIWCIRTTPQSGLNHGTRVFESTDGGHTWARLAASLAADLNNRDKSALLAPFQGGDPAYAVTGGVGVTNRPPVRWSNDDWATVTTRTTPTGYGGTNNDLPAYRRPERRYGDSDHVLAWFRHSAEPENRLLASEDQGANWSLLYDQNTNQQYGTPINWPVDDQMWVWVINRVGSDLAVIASAVVRTEDYFSNVADASGNLDSLLTSWVQGPGGGFFLPNPPVPCHPHAIYLYNGVDISAYINEIELEALTQEADTTNLGDTAETRKAKLPGNALNIGGDWTPEIDAILGFDAIGGRKRSSAATFDDCSGTVTLTWAEAFVTDWQVVTQATGKIVWSAKVRHNGAPTRTTS